MLNKKVQECTFSIQRFKIMIVTLSLTLVFAQAFYNYLCPACEKLQCIGSDNSNGKSNSYSVNDKDKCGPKRILLPEEELFCAL